MSLPFEPLKSDCRRTHYSLPAVGRKSQFFQSIKQSTNPSAGRSVGRSVSRWPAGRPANQPASQSINQSISVSPSVHLSISLLIGQSISLSGCLFIRTFPDRFSQKLITSVSDKLLVFKAGYQWGIPTHQFPLLSQNQYVHFLSICPVM